MPSLLIETQLAGDYRLIVFNDLPVGWWRLADAVSSSAALDKSGNARTGVVTGVTFGTAGHNPDGATVGTFNGTTARVVVADAAGLHLGDTCSLEIWIKRSSVSLGAAIVLFDGNTNALSVQIDTDNKIKIAKSGGAQIVKSTVAIADTTTWHHVAYTKSAATSKLYLDGVDVTGVVTDQTLSNSNTLTIGASTALSAFTPGALSDVAYYGVALTAAQVLTHYQSGIWTTLQDVSDGDVSISRRFQSNLPDDRIMAPSQASFGLDNSPYNKVGQQRYYSPDAGLFSGWGEGLVVRITVTANGTPFPRFYGWIQTVEPEPGLYEGQHVYVTASGWLLFAGVIAPFGLTVQTNKTDDALMTQLVATVPTPPVATAFATGLDVYPIAFDDVDGSSSKVSDVMDSIVMSGFYRVYERADGTLVGETRALRQTVAVDLLTLTDVAPGGRPGKASTGVKASRRRERIINEFVVTVTPRKVDPAAIVLYALPVDNAPLQLGPMSQQVLVVDFVDPNQKAQKINAQNTLISDGGAGAIVGTVGFLPAGDFLFGSSAGLSDLTGIITAAVVYEGSRATITLTNIDGSRTATCSLLQCRGQGVYTYQDVTIASGDAVSQRRGKNSVTIKCPYQGNPNFAQSASQYLLHAFGPSVTQLDDGVPVFIPSSDELTLADFLALEISSPVSISETMTAISAGKYWIDGIDETYDERMNTSIQLMLSPRDTQQYWAWGTVGFSEWGTTTVYGF